MINRRCNQPAGLALMLVLVGLGACVTARREDYTDAKHVFEHGEILFRLIPKASADGGASLVGPFEPVVALSLSDAPPLPDTCKVRYQSVRLLDARGESVATLPAQDVKPRTVMIDKNRPYPGMVGKKSAPIVSGSALALPYATYTFELEFVLSGCGVRDGSHKVRETLKPMPERRLTTHFFERLMSV